VAAAPKEIKPGVGAGCATGFVCRHGDVKASIEWARIEALTRLFFSIPEEKNCPEPTRPWPLQTHGGKVYRVTASGPGVRWADAIGCFRHTNKAFELEGRHKNSRLLRQSPVSENAKSSRAIGPTQLHESWWGKRIRPTTGHRTQLADSAIPPICCGDFAPPTESRRWR